MAWFWRVLAQWIVIAMFVAAPLVFSGAWPVLPVFCAVVVAGLVFYGLLNPEHALLRTIVWGGATCIAAGLAPADLTPLLEGLLQSRVPPKVVELLGVGLSLVLRAAVSWEAIAVLALLILLQIVIFAYEMIRGDVLPDRITLRAASAPGKMTLGRAPRLDVAATITNRTDQPIVITGAGLKAMRILHLPTELYCEGEAGPGELTALNPLELSPGRTASLEAIVRNLPSPLMILATTVAWLRLEWLIDFSASMKLDGDGALPETQTHVRFTIRRPARWRNQEAAPTR